MILNKVTKIQFLLAGKNGNEDEMLKINNFRYGLPIILTQGITMNRHIYEAPCTKGGSAPDK